MKLSLLISPEAQGAYFAEYLQVAETELRAVLGLQDIQHRSIGEMDFFDITWEGDMRPLARLSFVQGVFAQESDLLRPIPVDPEWGLHRNMIFGAKFKGKTNECLTQLLLNLGLSQIETAPEDVRVLDPMAGRGTTLLWAMSFGMEARGIELDPKAIPDLHRNAAKWARLTRLKHKIETGFAQKKNKQGQGAVFQLNATQTSLRLTQGDARGAAQIYRNMKFDLIVSDLPYGVQHTSGTSRNPLETLEECAEAWSDVITPNGALVLAFNAKNPKRAALEDVFSNAGWQITPIRAPHRMSESILRDILIAKRS